MTNGKTYQKKLVSGKTVQFTIAKRIGIAEASPGDVGCGNPNCTEHANTVSSGDEETGESRKVEAAFTSKNALLLRRLNYSKGREESHQVFESVPHLIANLNSALPEEQLLSSQLTAFSETGLTGEENAKKVAEELAKKNAPEEI